MGPVKYAHQIVKEQLRDKILDENYEIGDKLPTISLIADAFNVSVVTAVKSVKELVEDGILETRRGVGITVKRLPKRRVSEKKSILSINQSVSTWQPEMRKIFETAMPGWQILETHVDEANPNKYSEAFLDDFIKDHPFPVYVLTNAPRRFQEYFQNKRLPCVVLGSLEAGIDLPNVVPDAYERFYQAARSLRQKYPRIAFLQHKYTSQVEQDRYTGVMEALNEGHVSGALKEPQGIELVGYDEEKSKAGMVDFLRNAEFPIGVLCCNDIGAYWLLQEAIKMGVPIPGQLGIIAEGSLAGLLHTIPDMTYIRYDHAKLVFTLVRMLKDILRGYDVSTQHI
ncbi:MAG: GntR family transcriptional regulator, partial [Actinobacteria bacterium]|nr:GntR family transcriptional regulator [Actinomycetota bacterium]